MFSAAGLRKGTDLLDVVNAIVQEFVDPNTPDNREACVASINKAFVDYGYPNPKAGDYITDAVAAAAGGEGVVDRLLADLDNYFGGQAPAAIHNLAKEFLTDAEQSIREYRAGKPMPG